MGITYNISPSDIQGPVIAATVFGIVATLTTVLRLYAMSLKGIRLGLSEYILLVGTVLFGPNDEKQIQCEYRMTILAAIDVWRIINHMD
jgi:hypothetical protein